ncbi:MAG: AraC family transcriptional regulator ligand-binding domain-containing protein [Parvularculaceae bacterium]|nr:AraC family transcriptional regulator ligand-binding domain-containing protein [Parvularculaceae bacterium]
MERDIVRAGALTGYRRVVRELGGAPATLLAEHGLSDEMLDDPDCFIPYTGLMKLLEASAVRLGCSDLGLRIAAKQSMSTLGMMSVALRNAPDIRAAIKATSRSLYLHAPGLSVNMAPEFQKGREIVTYELSLQSAPRAVQTMELTMGLAVRITRMLAQRDDVITGVQFMHKPAATRVSYRRHLKLTPTFETNAYAIIIPRKGLEYSIAGANSEILAIFDSLLGLHSPNSGQSFDGQIDAVMTRLIRSGVAGLQDAADAIGLHPRALQRRLAERGTSFEAVRDAVRRRLAESYLAQKSIPLAHVAQLLCCADQTVLTRHCRRWFNMTPGSFRRHANENGG